MAAKQVTQSVLFIHGLFVTRHCWDAWVSRFQALGYLPTALAWPGRDAPVDKLRRNPPDPNLRSLTLAAVIEAHVQAIRAMAEPPVLIGHSLGGLIVQILLNRGLGAAGVAIDSAPPRGVLTTQWSFVRSNWPMLNLLIPASTPYMMSFPQFQYAFVNGMAVAQQREVYERTVVPESRRVWRGALSPVAQVDFGLPHAPLLMIAGSEDHIIPASLNRANYARYTALPSQADFREFPRRTHYLLNQPGWEEIADAVVAWMQ